MQKQSIDSLYIDFVAQELAEIRIYVQKSAIGPLRGLQYYSRQYVQITIDPRQNSFDSIALCTNNYRFKTKFI